jgi:hypothetical protein
MERIELDARRKGQRRCGQEKSIEKDRQTDRQTSDDLEKYKVCKDV